MRRRSPRVGRLRRRTCSRTASRCFRHEPKAKLSRLREAARHRSRAPVSGERRLARLHFKPRSRVVSNSVDELMTIFGNLSRGLNRMSGGPRGQTLCARIGERWPECLFCRLLSRIVEPNHCAIELARWHGRGTHAAARLPYEWPRPQATPYGSSWRTDRISYAHVDLDLGNSSSGTAVPQLLQAPGRSLRSAEAIANVRPRENR